METVQSLEARLVELVHPSARSDAAERVRHARFLATRLAAGFVAAVLVPPYLALRGAATGAELVALACLVAPFIAAFVASRTGRLVPAYAISSAGFAVVVSSVAAAVPYPGGLVVTWTVAVAFEAVLAGDRRSAVAALAAAAAGATAGMAVQAEGAWPQAYGLALFGAVAIPQAGALALAVICADAAPADARARDFEDRALLQAIDDLVTWHDRNGHVLKASPAAAKLLGVPAQTLNERGLLSRIHVQDRPAYLKAVSDAALGKRPVAVQFRLQRGEGGDLIWVEMRAHGIAEPDAHGAHAVVAVTRDISLQKRHEEDLELARLKAERADELKGRFLATVSHELRTPLNAIIGFSEVLASDSMSYLDADQRRGYARIIHESGHHLLDVVTSLLDMSKIETGNFDLAPEPFDAGALVEGCFDLMRLKADEAGIVMAREIDPGLPELVADRRACRQILINLISNAVKFTPSGGRVTVRLRRAGERFIFTVSDTGVGVAEADLRKLGSPFFQASSAYDRHHEGTGLGLSVVRGLVGLHHGALSIASTVGQGTCVTVELPLDCRVGGDARSATPIPIRTEARLHAVPEQEIRQSA